MQDLEKIYLLLLHVVITGKHIAIAICLAVHAEDIRVKELASS